jgi:hypothetical protein
MLVGRTVAAPGIAVSDFNGYSIARYRQYTRSVLWLPRGPQDRPPIIAA